MRRSMWPAMKAVPRATILGVATVFQPKADPREHWSRPGEIGVVVEVETEAAGAPPSGRIPDHA